jgi:hypothetical protein
MGAAPDSPDSVCTSKFEPLNAPVIGEPGALCRKPHQCNDSFDVYIMQTDQMSTQVPKFENPDMLSSLDVDPTVIALGAEGTHSNTNQKVT